MGFWLCGFPIEYLLSDRLRLGRIRRFIPANTAREASPRSDQHRGRHGGVSDAGTWRLSFHVDGCCEDLIDVEVVFEEDAVPWNVHRR